MGSGDIPPRDPSEVLTPGAPLHFSADGAVVAALGIGKVIFWDLASGTMSSRTGYQPEDHGYTSPALWSWRGSVLAMADWRDHVVTANLFNSTAGDLIAEVVVESKKGADPPDSLALNPDGSLVASSHWDGLVRMHSTRDGREVHRTKAKRGVPDEDGEGGPRASYTDDGRLVLSTHWVQCPIQFWDTDGSRLLSVMPKPDEPYYNFHHTRDGAFFLVLREWEDDDGARKVEPYDGASFELQHSHPMPSSPLASALHPGGTHLAWRARGDSAERRSFRSWSSNRERSPGFTRKVTPRMCWNSPPTAPHCCPWIPATESQPGTTPPQH